MSYMIVSPAEVRDYLELNPVPSSSRYSDETIGSNILGAQDFLERKTGRYFVDRPGVMWILDATMLRAQVPLPGFRAFSTVFWGGSSLVVGFQAGDSAACWAIPDYLNSGLYTGLQFRAWRVDNNPHWYYANPNWWDQLNDSPYYPGNWGGGYAWTSMPDDLVITGDGGYAQGSEPYYLRHAIKVLAGFYTQRGPTIVADTIITPAGGVMQTSRLPGEVEDFIADWKIGGTQAVSM